MPENADAKGRRYLAEGRVTLRHVGVDGVGAIVRGDGAWHRAGYADGRWYCTCPALSANCSHLVALRLVTVAPTETRTA
jgi:uncharacterized Zn finger protein